MLRSVLLTLFFVAACTPAPPAAASPTPTAASQVHPTPTPEVSLTPTPGIVLRGHVRLKDGTGLAGVRICRSFASYDGVQVAITGQDGSFQSDFAFIPGDEMISVWAGGAGYRFEPAFVRWRHYYGLEDHSLDFVAVPASATEVPPAACS